MRSFTREASPAVEGGDTAKRLHRGQGQLTEREEQCICTVYPRRKGCHAFQDPGGF